jgi:DNA transposition AAA+ family ATPase
MLIFDDISVSFAAILTVRSSAQELKEAFRGFVLTKDNVVKLVDVAERLRAKLSCILMGEAGCGKTAPCCALGLV